MTIAHDQGYSFSLYFILVGVAVLFSALGYLVGRWSSALQEPGDTYI
jgi:hypothetical protein